MNMGYIDHSMSVRAAQAYTDGLMPASKLAKRTGVPTKLIAQYVAPREWHHTSKYYNCTDFFAEQDVRDTFGLEGGDRDMADDEAVAALAALRDTRPAERVAYGELRYAVWSGSRRYRRKTDCSYIGYVTVTDDWYKWRDSTGRARRVAVHNAEFAEMPRP